MGSFRAVYSTFITPLVRFDGMRRFIGSMCGRVKRQLVTDLKSDPYLVYILILATVLAGFWFWHRIPSFATNDEHARLVDPMRAVGIFVSDPSFDSLQRGITRGRLYGATFYLYGIVLIPVFIAVFLADITESYSVAGPWYQWRAAPEWVWTWSLLLGRLVNVSFAVGCVYLTYRIGTQMQDRATGRLAAVLLSLTWGFLMTAHEVGEDVPMLFFLLFVFYLALRYIETGDRSTFLAGCILGGFAIVVKLSGGTSVVFLGIAYLLRVRHTESGWRDVLIQPRLLVAGALLGMAAVVVGFPGVLVSGPEALVSRPLKMTEDKARAMGGPTASIGWWLLRGYLNGLGLPLFVAVAGGVAASIVRLRERSPKIDGIVLLLAGLSVYLFVFLRWEYVRVHHLLPTFPFLVLLLGAALVRFHDHNRSVARPFIAILLVTSGIYAVSGDLYYASQPRDEATEWLEANASENAMMEVYEYSLQEVALPYGMDLSRYGTRDKSSGNGRVTRVEWMRDLPKRCPEYIQLTYRDLLRLDPYNVSRRSKKYKSVPQQAEYLRDLLAEDTYPYTVAAKFGPEPRFFAPKPPSQTFPPELLRVGLIPWSMKYGDEQDIGAIEQYTVILERTARCTPRDSHRSRMESRRINSPHADIPYVNRSESIM
jgi:hypothetical protein